MYWGDGLNTNPVPASFPAGGSGYQHVSMPLASFTDAHGSLLNPTDNLLAFYLGFVVYGLANVGIVEVDVENIQLWMTNPPVVYPTLSVVPAKPGLRVFAQDSTHPYNQEGFGTQDPNQSWVGQATPSTPVSYAITFADFDTVNGFTCFVQFAPGASPSDPYGVYNANHAIYWSITHPAPGGYFYTSVDWKTNHPGNGADYNALAFTTTSCTDGRGTWILTFTNDTDGTVLAPDGSSGSFSLPPEAAALFANPVTIDFGSCPNWNTAGYGQWITYGKIAITNVVDGNEYDDFTQDTSLNTSLWNPGFSFNKNPAPNCVVQVPPGNNYWVNWTVPDDGYGLGTKADLGNASIPWYTPSYYGNGVVANTTPTLMGGRLKWTLVPAGCMPTVDGTQGGTPSTTGFFRLSNPAPSQ